MMKPNRGYFALDWLKVVLAAFCLAATVSSAVAGNEGLLKKDGERLYPIGFYELPEGDTQLREMAQAGVNFVRCHSPEDLDRAEAAGMLGVFPIGVQQGATDALRKRIESVCDHPALAVWEGPDEIVWNFTAYSGLHRIEHIYETRDDWWNQTPVAVAYSEKKAEEILPKIREGIALVRSLDKKNRQFWINEALKSDTRFVRGYMDQIDITGCDIYPVKAEDRRVARMGPAVERWKMVGRGKPVWMVLQAFAWSELGDYYDVKKTAYPTFAESRFMAYDVIVHGARGIAYWGSAYLKSGAFRQSLYALTSELSALQPFLIAPEQTGPKVSLIELPSLEKQLGVRATVRRSGRDWLVVLVNEDDVRHMGVEVSGLKKLNGRQLRRLYGGEEATIEKGEFVTRMQPNEVKIFATSRKWESSRTRGRDFVK